MVPALLTVADSDIFVRGAYRVGMQDSKLTFRPATRGQSLSVESVARAALHANHLGTYHNVAHYDVAGVRVEVRRGDSRYPSRLETVIMDERELKIQALRYVSMG